MIVSHVPNLVGTQKEEHTGDIHYHHPRYVQCISQYKSKDTLWINQVLQH